jgi:transposase
MLIQTILNRLDHHKGFVYGNAAWSDRNRTSIKIPVRARANSKPICSGCQKPGTTYDHLRKRLFQYVPLWQVYVFFVYARRRVDCADCGVTVELLPWAEGKCQLTNTYRWFLAGWAKRLSWKEAAAVFGTTWQSVCRSVEMAVEWGLAHRNLRGITAIGIDEIQWRLGHHYLTLVYQIDEGCKRLLWIGLERTKESLEGFFDYLGRRRSGALKFICSDMWQPYLDVIAEKAKAAVHILDRFHIMSRMNKAIDEVRAGEARRLVADGYKPVLKHSRWCLLKRPENLTEKQTVKMAELLRYNLRAVRAYLHREDFQRFWTYLQWWAARRFLREWCTRVMRSRIEPMKKIARSLRKHEPLILNWFKAKGRISAGVVEGFNNKAKLTMRRSYGFRSSRIIQLALYHNLGNLPEPVFTHRFW